MKGPASPVGLTGSNLIPQTWMSCCIPQDTCAWHQHPGQRDQVALNGKRLPKKPSGRWVLPCRAHGSGSSPGHGAASVFMAGSPSLRLRKSATISLLPWITRPARGSLCPPHPTTSSQQTGFFWGLPTWKGLALTLSPKPTALHQRHGCRRLRRICWDGKNNEVKIAAPASPPALPMAPTSPQPPGWGFTLVAPGILGG